MLVPTADTLARLGAALGERLFEGAVVCLVGDLGAGKTTFAQGVARGLGVVGTVPSPTFVIVAEYPEARVPLRHADLYRVETEAELRGLGLEERVGEEGVWLVEWADRFPALAPADHLEVRLAHAGEGRRLTARATGPRHAPLLEGLRD